MDRLQYLELKEARLYNRIRKIAVGVISNIAYLLICCVGCRTVKNYPVVVERVDNGFYTSKIGVRSMRHNNVHFTLSVGFSNYNVGDTVVLPWVNRKLLK